MPDIFQYDFMLRSMAAAAMIGALAPSFGVFLVLRRLSLIADSLAHVALAGVAIGLLTRTFPPYLALASTSLAAVGIEQLRVRRMMPGDAALAVVLYGALAVAVVIISLAEGFNANLYGYLFGSILTATTTDLWMIGALLVGVALMLTLFFVELAQTSYDTDLARISGVRINLVNLALALVTGATITVSMRVVGVLLVGALIVTPVLIGLRLTTGLGAAIIASALIGVVIGVGGIVIAFYADVAPGGAVVLTGVGLLIAVEVSFFLLRRLGLVGRSKEVVHSHPPRPAAPGSHGELEARGVESGGSGYAPKGEDSVDDRSVTRRG